MVGRDPQTEGLTKRVTIEHNLFVDINGPKWGGAGIFLLVVAGPRALVVDHNTAVQTGDTIVVDGARSREFTFTNNIAAKGRYGVKGASVGQGTATLERYFPGYAFARNAIIGAPASVYPPDNFFPATPGDVGFVDLAGGDYHLAPGSPYAGMGLDGLDIGADIDALP